MAAGAATGAGARITWREATVAEVRDETPHARTLILDVPDWPGHAAGQHLDVRLTAEDGYQAERSYSIASAPEDERVALTIERIDDGEVSPYLAGEVVAGDRFEVRGPIGGHFTWRAADGGPLLLIGGGSGLVPLMAMLRHRARGGQRRRRAPAAQRARTGRCSTATSSSALALRRRAPSITYTLTRDAPPGWTGFAPARRRRHAGRRRSRGGDRPHGLRLRTDAASSRPSPTPSSASATPRP